MKSADGFQMSPYHDDYGVSLVQSVCHRPTVVPRDAPGPNIPLQLPIAVSTADQRPMLRHLRPSASSLLFPSTSSVLPRLLLHEYLHLRLIPAERLLTSSIPHSRSRPSRPVSTSLPHDHSLPFPPRRTTPQRHLGLSIGSPASHYPANPRLLRALPPTVT